MLDIVDWVENVTPVELKKVAEHAQTSERYIKLIKDGWGNPSIRLRTALVEASKSITPDRVLCFSQKYDDDVKLGRPSRLDVEQQQNLINDYKTTKKYVKTLAKIYGIEKGTVYYCLRKNNVKRFRRTYAALQDY
jgi:transcriptional regulator of acetoin/glycerol metabolism